MPSPKSIMSEMKEKLESYKPSKDKAPIPPTTSELLEGLDKPNIPPMPEHLKRK